MNFGGKTIEKIEHLEILSLLNQKNAFRRGRIYEPAAQEKYLDVMKFHLNRYINVRETGPLQQTKLFNLWL